jgi:hypothetical protein
MEGQHWPVCDMARGVGWPHWWCAQAGLAVQRNSGCDALGPVDRPSCRHVTHNGREDLSRDTPAQLTVLLDHIAHKGGPVMSDHVLAIVRKQFNWHATRDGEFCSPFVIGIGSQPPVGQLPWYRMAFGPGGRL